MKSPIFICGTGRSGTTILQKIISSHKNIYAMRYEGRFIVSNGGLLDVLNAWNIEAFEIFKKKMLNEWYMSKIYNKGKSNEYFAGICAHINKELLSEIINKFQKKFLCSISVNQKKQCIRDFVAEFFELQLLNTGKTRWLEKTPQNLLYMNELQDLFPTAKFIHIIRDGRDVAASIIRRDFWPIRDYKKINFFTVNRRRTIFNCAIYWKELITIGREIGRALGKERYLETKYEDIINSPYNELKKI